MERKELEPQILNYGNGVFRTVYPADKADAVMDGLELQHKADAELIAADRRNMEQMKKRINVLEKQSEVTDRMLQDMASNNNREFLPDSNKELGTELGTQLGTKWISVKDRLPKECESVLVYDAKCNDYEIMWREEIGNEWEWTNGEYNLSNTSYTHWMPLPSVEVLK